MLKTGLLVRFKAKPGKEKDVEKFLLESLEVVEGEANTVAWFAIRLGPDEFGIFDAFPDAESRQVHLEGKIAAGLMAKMPELFVGAPKIENLDILADKLPGEDQYRKDLPPEAYAP